MLESDKQLMLLHNLTHGHATATPPSDMRQGKIHICYRKFPSKFKQAVWVPEGYTWGYVIEDAPDRMAEFFETVLDPERYAQWTATARHTNDPEGH